MATFSFNASQGFKDLLSPFTNLFKKPQGSLSTPARPQSPTISPAIPEVNFAPTNFSPGRVGATPTAATPANISTIYGPRYFGPPVLPQVKSSTAPTATKPPVLPVPPAVPPPTVPPVTPPAKPETSAFAQPQPFTPTPAQQKALQDTETTYQKSLQLSPEELSTQEDLDKLVESARRSYTNTRNQAIPLEFITGQLASIERRALNLAEPLERKLSRLQAARVASSEASKFALERADKAIESARSEAKDIRTEAESARRFGIEQAGATEGRAIQRETLAQNKAIADRQFEEDKRQFGQTHALQQYEASLKKAGLDIQSREVAIKEKELAATTGASGVIPPESGQALQLVNEILPNVAQISGVFRTGRFTGTGQKLNQLISNLSVNARKLIKGQGQVSDYEAKILADSTNALSGGYFSGKLSENFVEQELKKIRGVINANAGLDVNVKIIDPSNNQAKEGLTNRQTIFEAASQGYIIQYQ